MCIRDSKDTQGDSSEPAGEQTTEERTTEPQTNEDGSLVKPKNACLLYTSIRVIGFDSVNDYYDIRLKESRLEKLQKHRNFIFIKANLADKDKVLSLIHILKCRGCPS